MNPVSPQLDERRRERIEPGLDIALAALRRIAERASTNAKSGSVMEVVQPALGQIEALLPEKAQQR
jgi:hypothetical protein